ncbi:MAG TPA: MFS transporter [Solirubrobacteraceae bacterium]
MASQERSEEAGRGVMLLIAGTMFMELLDGTIISTAAPAMARSFGVSAPQMAITITAYLITLAALIPLSGWLADRFGSRTMFVAGIAVFTVASGLCATTHSLAELTALRVLQGAGGATMVPIGRMVVLRVTGKGALVRAMAFLTWPALVAPIAAPLAGGALTTYLSWRWIFVINLPLGVLALACSLRLVPQIRGAERERLDWGGFVLTTICLVAVVVGCAALGAPKVRWVEVVVAVAVAAGVGVAAVRHLLGVPEPLLDLRLFRVSTFRMSNTSGSINRLTIQAMPFVLPLLFQVGFGWTPVKSGAVVIALFGGNLGIKPATTWMLNRFGFRAVIVAANWVAAATMVACGLFSAQTSLVVIIAVLVVSGAARSSGFTAYNTIIFADIDPDDMRHANTIAWTSFQLAVAVGVALGAVAVRVGAWAAPAIGGGSATPAYRTAFLILALATFVAGAQALRIHGDAGGQLLRNRRAVAPSRSS